MRIFPVILLLLTSSLVGISSTYAFAYGTITITSAPTAIAGGDEPSVVVHAEWSGASGGSISIDLKVSNQYLCGECAANTYSYGADCQSGCQNNLPNGKSDVTFVLRAGILYPDYSYYIYPLSLTIYATLSECAESQCTPLTSSQPVTITITNWSW